ncbi:hypothetical protein DSC45_33080 [Streptomyces sp. YIM 130001]|uniref:hypothetical protein n=1 Tax=Streptomyces sp. YIM 130001 TaxID=2259644 RepID=UPI000E6493EE|nr:hypothetical protein [Streptomyces sp. YIM 130001]RII08551.1 hypothetical protein DSC45_33080 [Streptomyces sp. YIM 130001]
MRARILITSAAAAALLVGGLAAPASAAPSAGAFVTNGDRVHVSSTPPRTASAHAWWIKINGPGTKAKVTIWLEMKSTGGKWHAVSKGAKTVKSGGGSARRAVARKKCSNSKPRMWRTKIDVDIVGVADSPEKVYTKAVKVKCAV